jgi:hypothetical protein
MSTPTTHFAPLARALHWLMALMVIAMLFIGAGMVASVSERHEWLLNLHKPLGIAILLLVIVRLIVRFCTRTPPLPADLPEVAGAGGEAVALSVVCPDAGDAVDWLGDDFRRRGPGHAGQFGAPAIDCGCACRNLRFSAQGPSVSGVSVLPDHPHAPGSGAVSWVGEEG